MLQKLDEQIAEAIARARAADQRAREATDPELRLDNERLAQSWRLLARSFHFVESLEQFLIDTAPDDRSTASYQFQGNKLIGITPWEGERDLSCRRRGAHSTRARSRGAA